MAPMFFISSKRLDLSPPPWDQGEVEEGCLAELGFKRAVNPYTTLGDWNHPRGRQLQATRFTCTVEQTTPGDANRRAYRVLLAWLLFSVKEWKQPLLIIMSKVTSSPDCARPNSFVSINFCAVFWPILDLFSLLRSWSLSQVQVLLD